MLTRRTASAPAGARRTPCSTPRAPETDRVRDRDARARAVRDDHQTAQPEQVPAAVRLRVEPPRTRRAPGRISSPPSFPRTDDSSSVRSASSRLRIVPSIVFSATLPVKPSVTTTSASPSSSRLLSMFPAKRSRARAEELVRLERQLVALLVLLADRHQPDLRPLDAEDLLGEDRAHVRELEQVLGAGVRVRARVDEHARAALRRDDDGDPRPVHAGKPPDVQERRREHRARVPRGDDDVGVPVGDRPTARTSDESGFARTASTGWSSIAIALRRLDEWQAVRLEPGRAEEDRRDIRRTRPRPHRRRSRRERGLPLARRPRPGSCAGRLRRLDAERLDLPAPVRLAVRADAVRALRLPAVRADLHARRRDPVLRAALVAPRLRCLSLRDGHERLRSIARCARRLGCKTGAAVNRRGNHGTM